MEIISVSIDDNRQAWLSAIGQDGSDWKTCPTWKADNLKIATAYSVKGIPCTFILDDENRIVAKNLRGKDLEEEDRRDAEKEEIASVRSTLNRDRL